MGGSIRFPSAAAGLTGLKPTWGRVSRAGVFDMTGQATLSHNGGFDVRSVPLGFQPIGHAVREEVLLKVGHACQSVTDFHTRHPAL